MTRYIGKQPAFGNFVKLDSISVVNGQAAYTMQSGSSNFTNYDNVNQFIVSLNGVIQAPTDSFTVSGSTITFASALTTGDVINFILVLGDVLSVGTPSDNTVSTTKLQNTSVTADKLATDSVIEAKIQDDAVTRDKINAISTSSLPSFEAKGTVGQSDGYIQLNCEYNSHGIKLKSPPHSAGQSYTLTFPSTAPATDKFLQTNSSGVLSFADAGGGMWTYISSTDVTSAVAQVDFTSLSSTYSDFKLVIQNLHIGTDGQNPELRFFDTAGNIKTSNYNWVYQGFDTGAKETYSASSGEIRLSAGFGSASHEHANLEITVYDVHETGQATATEGWKMASAEVVYSNAAGEFGRIQSGGMWKDNEGGDYSITGLRFMLSSGNIESGRFTLYGRKHS